MWICGWWSVFTCNGFGPRLLQIVPWVEFSYCLDRIIVATNPLLSRAAIGSSHIDPGPSTPTCLSTGPEGRNERNYLLTARLPLQRCTPLNERNNNTYSQYGTPKRYYIESNPTKDEIDYNNTYRDTGRIVQFNKSLYFHAPSLFALHGRGSRGWFLWLWSASRARFPCSVSYLRL